MKFLTCVALILPSAVQGFSVPDISQASVDSQRRNLFVALPAAFLAPTVSNALDMDAFVNAEIEKDSKKTDLTPDEAMCKYGQSGEKKSQACKRVKAAGGKVDSGKKEKSLGGAYAM